MSVFIIGDTHLSAASGKPMDVFGGSWENYTQKLESNWKNIVSADDTVVIAGDISWGMSLDQSLPDFEFLESLPGKKVLLKGNHDYWWDTVSKMSTFLKKNGINSIEFLYNNCIICGGYAICGTRGWQRGDTDQDDKIIAREAGRLERSLLCAPPECEKIAVLHYPPVYEDGCIAEFVEILNKYGVKRCFYGHLHANAIHHAVEGTISDIDFSLVSADSIDFCPVNI